MLNNRQLIIASHPDDEILGCGGAINKLRKAGTDVYVLILTAGASTRYPSGMEAVLKNHANKANKILGTKDVFFENLPNQQLDTIPISQITRVIEKYIEKIKPESIFTQHGGDLNKDHRLVYEASITAARPVPGQIVKKIYTYFVPSSSEWNFIEGEKVFIPNVFVDIKDEIDAKMKAIKCYASECRGYPHPRSAEALKAYAHYWGLGVGMEYAEPFRLIRDISGEI